MNHPTKKINGKGLKSELQSEGIQVISCKKGTGSLSECVNLVISSDDLKHSMRIMKAMNIVNSRGQYFNYDRYKTTYDYVQFMNCKGIDFDKMEELGMI